MLMCFAFAKAESATFFQNYKEHVVQQGETVNSLAQQYNITAKELLQLNPDLQSGVKVGSIILIPSRSNGLTQARIKEYKKHRVRRKQTLYGIAKKYGVTELDIKEANKELYSTGLRKGDRIRIPVFEKQIKIEDPITTTDKPKDPTTVLEIPAGKHIVKPKETVYGLSKQYGITMTEFKELNPGVTILKPGMLVNIPAVAQEPDVEPIAIDASLKSYTVPSKMTMYSLEKMTGISSDSLIALNPSLKDGIKAGMNINIPNHTTDSLVKVSTYATLVDSLSNFNPQRIAVMLPFSMQNLTAETPTEDVLKKDRTLRIALDFYSGMMIARDSAKMLGLQVEYDVFDTQKSEKQVRSIIAANDFSSYNMVIGPLTSKSVVVAAKELKGLNIPVISPLTNTDVKLYKNLVQARPEKAFLNARLYEYLKKNGEGKNIIIVNNAKNPDLKNEVVALFPSANVLKPNKDNYIFKQNYLDALSDTIENWVILATLNEGFITDAVSHYSAKAVSHKITMFGFDDFDQFGLPNPRLASLKYTYPSMNKLNFENNSFTARYVKSYNISPNDYATRGFDVAMDAILRQASATDFYESVMRNGKTVMTGNKFNYLKKNIAGYHNEAVYLLQYQEDLSIKELD